jgi:DNA modification methylase
VLGRSDYHWRHELLFTGTTPPEKRKRAKEGSPVHYGWRPGAAHFFITDRTLDSVWEIPRPRRSAEHPTMKPSELVERCIIASSRRGDLVLDPFVGSGTTLIACERTHRTARVVELDPAYGQVVIERWNALGKEQAVREP